MPLPLPLRMLDWRERKKDGPIRNKCERIVIFKRLFDPKEFEVRIQTQQELNYCCLKCTHSTGINQFFQYVEYTAQVGPCTCTHYDVALTHTLTVALTHTLTCPPCQEDPTLITDIRSDLREECEKFGIVKKIMVFDVSEQLS